VKLVIVATHPIQHFCPQYRSLAALPGVDVLVVFDSLQGVESYFDDGFATEVSWGRGLLDGYEHTTLTSQNLDTLLNQVDPDWLVVYGYASPVARKTWAWALRHPRTKFAYIADSEQRHRQPPSLRSRAKSVFLSALFRRVDAFLTVGDANEEYYRSHLVGPSKLIRMHFPIDPTLEFSEDAGKQHRERLGIAPDALVVLNVGKFEQRKRQADAIEACRDAPGVHLLLAGSGSELDNCRARADGMSNVTFLGFQAPEDLASYYALADVYVHPSEFDPHPLSVSEAAAAGCALVVSDAIGSWGATDDVIPGETGLVYSVADVDGLAESIKRLEDDRERCRTMGQRAQETSVRYQKRAHGGFVADLLRMPN
jgi:glycosyltransferase involved in cell wall biosynthesis